MKRNGKEKKEKVLEAAIKIFSSKGFSGATTSEIAKEAQVAEGTIFRYFPRKKDLLHGAVLKAVELFTESLAVDSLKDLLEKNKDDSLELFLKAVIMDRVKIFEEYFPLMKVIFYEMQFHEDVKELFLDKSSNNLLGVGEKIFEKCREKGALKDINYFLAIRSLMGMVFFMMIQREFLPDERATENLENEIEMTIDIFLNGLRR